MSAGSADAPPADKGKGAGITDWVSLPVLAYLVVWWFSLPSLEAMKTTDAANGFFTTHGAILPALGLALAGAVAWAIVPAASRPSLPRKVNIVPPVLALAAAVAMFVVVPRVFTHARIIRLEVEAAELRVSRTKKMGEVEMQLALLQAKQSGDKKLEESVEAAKKDVEAEKSRADKAIEEARKEAADRIAAAEKKGGDAVRDAEVQAQARRDVEKERDRLEKEAKERSQEPADTDKDRSKDAAKDKDAPKDKDEAGGSVKDKGAGKGGGGPDEAANPLGDLLKAGIVAALSAWNPIAGAIAAQLLGVTLGNETKLVQEVGDAVRSSLPGGKFDPVKAAQEMRRLARTLGPEERKKAEDFLKQARDKAKAAKGREAAEAAEAFEKMLEELSKAPPAEKLPALNEFVQEKWKEQVKDKATELNLANIYRLTQERYRDAPKARAAVLDVAKRKGVPKDVLDKAEKQMK